MELKHRSYFQISRIETPEPTSRNHEFMSKMMLDGIIQDGEKYKIKSGMRRHLQAKRALTDRKDKRISSN